MMQRIQVFWRAVRQGRVRLAPNIFCWVEFRGITRKTVHLQARVSLQQRLDSRVAMDRAIVPQQNDRAGQLLEQVLQETSDIRAFETAPPKLEIQGQMAVLGRQRYGADRRNLLMFEQIFHRWRSTFRSPSPFHIRDQQKATFIEKNKVCAQAFRLFFTWGQT